MKGYSLARDLVFPTPFKADNMACANETEATFRWFGPPAVYTINTRFDNFVIATVMRPSLYSKAEGGECGES